MFGLSSHESFVLGVACLWFVSAAVGALSVPTPTSSNFYKWFFGFSKTIVGDLGSVFTKYIPTLPPPPSTSVTVSDTKTIGDVSQTKTATIKQS